MKRDRFPGIMDWSQKIGGLLCIIVSLGMAVVVWRTSPGWLSSSLVDKGVTIVAVACGFGMGWQLLTDKKGQQSIRVEALRRKPEEAALYPIQPEEDVAKCSLPLILSRHASFRFSLGCLVFLLVVGGACMALVDFFSHVAESWEFVVTDAMFWIILLSISLGLVDILMYQRIEATAQGLSVQIGLKRRTMTWEQAKLFAVVRLDHPDGRPIRYELSSARTLLRWEVSYQLAMITTPRVWQEYEQRHRDLLSCIRLHTGLPLLDLR